METRNVITKLQNNISVRRKVSGLTQSQLAEKIEVTRQTIAAIEKGDYSPSVFLALRLAAALHTPINELFWLEDIS